MTTRTFPLTGPISLVGRIGHGSFHVIETDDRTEASVTLTARSARSDTLERTVVEMKGTALVIVSPRQGGLLELFGHNRDAIDVEVSVPSGTPVTVSTFTADVAVTGRCGTADVAVGAAEITLDHVDGDLRLRFGSGACRVGPVRGSVQVRSGSGSARFGDIGGSLNAGCGSGELEVATVRGGVRSRTGSGGASLGAVYGDVDLASGSGRLSIGLPAGVPARLDLTTGSGHVDSELPISGAPISEAASAAGKAITVRARTGSGDVRLFRAAA